MKIEYTEEFQIDDKYKIKFDRNNWYIDIFEGDKKIERNPSRLFKYYAFNENNLDSLLKHYFYLANPATFNDPFDCSRKLIDFKSEGRDHNHYDDLGVCSFSTNNLNPLMWGHYADKYNGYVLEFNTQKYLDQEFLNIESNNEKTSILYHFLPVLYSRNPNKIENSRVYKKLYTLIMKYYDWNYEDEFRIIGHYFRKSRGNKPFDRINVYPKDFATSIYIGYKLFESKGYEILSLILEKHFPDLKKFLVYPCGEKLRLDYKSIK